MSKYNKPRLTMGERFKDARIVHNKHGKETTSAVAKATGVSKSTLSEIENDSRVPGAKIIAELARHYGVSTDYLLGLSDVITPDATAQAAIAYTGLSESAIRFLHSNVEQSINPSYEHLCDPSILVSWGHELIESVNKGLKDSAGARVRWPIETIEKLLSSEESVGILSDLFLFLTLDIGGTGSISISATNDDTGHFFEEQIDGDIIAWGYLKRAESKLATLRQESLKANKIDYYF